MGDFATVDVALLAQVDAAGGWWQLRPHHDALSVPVGLCLVVKSVATGQCNEYRTADHNLEKVVRQGVRWLVQGKTVHMLKEVSKGIVTAKCGSEFKTGDRDHHGSIWQSDVDCSDCLAGYKPKKPIKKTAGQALAAKKPPPEVVDDDEDIW